MRRLIIDANLLVLLIVGRMDRSLVTRHRRTKQFSVEDYDLLSEYLTPFDQVVVTSGILTECSNLLRQADEFTAKRLMEGLALLISDVDEQRVPAADVRGAEHFCRLGLTDSTILEAMGNHLPLLTADLDLYLTANRVYGGASINFHYLRRL